MHGVLACDHCSSRPLLLCSSTKQYRCFLSWVLDARTNVDTATHGKRFGDPVIQISPPCFVRAAVVPPAVTVLDILPSRTHTVA